MYLDVQEAGDIDSLELIFNGDTDSVIAIEVKDHTVHFGSVLIWIGIICGVVVLICCIICWALSGKRKQDRDNMKPILGIVDAPSKIFF